MVVTRCQQTAQHVMQVGRASPSTSITLGQQCLRRRRATSISGSTCKLQVMNSCLAIFQAAVSKEKKELTSSPCSYTVHLTCDTATDCLIAHLVQSVPPLSPIVKCVIASYISRKCLPCSGFSRMSCTVVSANISHPEKNSVPQAPSPILVIPTAVQLVVTHLYVLQVS